MATSLRLEIRQGAIAVWREHLVSEMHSKDDERTLKLSVRRVLS
jgi:hypothetical protein